MGISKRKQHSLGIKRLEQLDIKDFSNIIFTDNTATKNFNS